MYPSYKVVLNTPTIVLCIHVLHMYTYVDVHTYTVYSVYVRTYMHSAGLHIQVHIHTECIHTCMHVVDRLH